MLIVFFKNDIFSFKLNFFVVVEICIDVNEDKEVVLLGDKVESIGVLNVVV